MNGRRSQHLRRRSLGIAAAVCLLVFVGVLVVLLGMRTSTPATVRPVAVLSGDWAPFSGEDLPGGGPMVEIMTDILQSAGFDPQVSFTTWGSAEERVAEGSAFGAFPLVSSENRRDRLLYSDSLMAFDYVLFVRPGDAEAPASSADLADLRVGGIDGYDYWTELDAAVDDIIRYPSTAAGLLALAEGEIDVLAEGEIPGMTALADPHLAIDATDITVLDVDERWARSTENLYFVMPRSDDAERALERLNVAIGHVKNTPEYTMRTAGLTSTGQDWVRLVNPEGGLVPLQDAAGTVIGESPVGVNGIVMQWPDDVDTSRRVQIKVGNGPFEARIVWVDMRLVEVTE